MVNRLYKGGNRIGKPCLEIFNNSKLEEKHPVGAEEDSRRCKRPMDSSNKEEGGWAVGEEDQRRGD